LSGCKTDMCITHKATGFEIINGSNALGFSVRASPNVRANIESVPEEDAFQYAQAIKNNKVYGRSLLGMTLDFSLQEVLVKWGSEVAFEREKDVLLYG